MKNNSTQFDPAFYLPLIKDVFSIFPSILRAPLQSESIHSQRILQSDNRSDRRPLHVVYTTTEDGVDLAIGNYRRQGALPVLLMHGLSQNYRVWDFPVEGHNFAHYLFDHGYDVWLPCLRGHGSGFLQSSQMKGQETIDDLAIYDIPAIVDKIIEETGKQPVWIGHSMGGMLAYMYLEGVRYEKKVVGHEYIEWDGTQREVCSNCAVGDPELAQQRNRKLKALVTIGTPIKMAWNTTELDRKGKLGFWQSNKIFPLIANLKAVRAVSSQLPYIPTASFFNFLSYDNHEQIPWFKKIAQWSVNRVANSYLSSVFWYPPNMNKELIEHLLYATLNDIGPGVLEQFADWIEHKTFRAYIQQNETPYVYCENFDKIVVSLLMITGNRDKIASYEIVYHQGFLKMGSKKKDFHCFPEFGHNDLCVGLTAHQEIYPFIEKWIRKYRDTESKWEDSL